MAYSEDFRLKVMKFLDEGHTQVESCTVFKISWGTVCRWRRRYSITGGVKDDPPLRKPRTPKKLNPEKLKKYVKAHPRATYAEIGKAFGCSSATVYRGFNRLGIARKSTFKIEQEEFKTFVEAHPYAVYKEIGSVFGCTASAVSIAFKRYGLIRGRRRKKLDIEGLKKYIEQHPHTTCSEMGKTFGYSGTTIRETLKLFGATYDFVERKWKIRD